MALSTRFAVGYHETIARECCTVSELIFLVEDAPEGGFVAKALGQSIFTQADTVEELRASVREAVACHFDEGMGTHIIRLHFVRDEQSMLM
jgi:predicted RNase H-like HicB family nuclease